MLQQLDIGYDDNDDADDDDEDINVDNYVTTFRLMRPLQTEMNLMTIKMMVLITMNQLLGSRQGC